MNVATRNASRIHCRNNVMSPLRITKRASSSTLLTFGYVLTAAWRIVSTSSSDARIPVLTAIARKAAS